MAAPTTGGPNISPSDRKKIKLALAEANTFPLNSWPSNVSPSEQKLMMDPPIIKRNKKRITAISKIAGKIAKAMTLTHDI